MTMSSVHHENIDTRGHQRIDTLIGVRAGTHRGTNTQLTETVFTGVGERLCFIEIFYRNQTFQDTRIVDDQNLFNTMFVK